MTDAEIAELYRQYHLVNGFVGPVQAQVLSKWALDTGRCFAPPPIDPVTRLARRISEGLRNQHVVDKQGRYTREMHAVTEWENGEKVTNWYEISRIPAAKMKLSSAQRRNGITNDCRQLKNDIDSYNQNYNTGEQINIRFDFSKDLEEMELGEAG